MQVDRVVDVERGQKGKDIGLDRTHQQFQQGDTDHQDERRQADQRCNPKRFRVEAVDHEACEHLHQHVAGGHRDEKTQCEAEGANEEGEKLDERDEPEQPPGRAVRHEQAEEMQAMAPEADDKNRTKAENRENRSDRQVAGYGESVRAGNDTDRHHAHEVGEEDEHEKREDQGHIFLALGPDARAHHVVDKAGDAFDGHLPATGDELALHAASHENPDRAEHDQHEQRRVCERDVVAE